MKKIILQLILMMLSINIAFADDLGAGTSQPIKRHEPPDLSTFPEMFINEGDFDAIIVVGDKASASDVIAQSNLIQFFISYTGKTMVGSAKLASEVSTLEQNIISIGSPCHNPISAQIMIDPKPCDKWLEPGKAFILLYYYKGYTHMIIEGYSDKGTRDAVNFLVNSKIGGLRGANVLVEVDEPKSEINESSIKEESAVKEENISVNIEEEKEKLVSELTERIANKSKESGINATSAINKAKEKLPIKQNKIIKTEQKEEEKEAGIIKRIVEWVSSLFRRQK